MISVCIATHNGGKFLREQLNSILSQIDEYDEIIISDDGSTDNTKDIIISYNDPRIRIVDFIQPEKVISKSLAGIQFATRNFENALKYVEGDYVFLCDQDDIWYPNKVEVMMKALNNNDIVKHNYSVIDSSGKQIIKSVYNTQKQVNRGWIHLFRYLPFRGCCMAFRRWVVDEANPFPKNCLQHDSWIGMIAKLKKAKYCYIEYPLIYHRVHSMNASELPKKNSLIFQLSYRMRLLAQLFSNK